MFKDIIPDDNIGFTTTRVIIKKNGLNMASFRGDHVIGQIESERVKSINTRYDHISMMKIIEIEV